MNGSSSQAPYTSHWPASLQHPALFRLFDSLRDRWRDRAERRRFAQRSLPRTANRVLVIRDRGLGDVLQVTTILQAIRARYQARTLDLMTCEAGRALLAPDTRINHILLTANPPEDLGQRYDIFINLHLFDHSESARAVVQSLPEDKLLGRTFRPGRNEHWIQHLAGGCWLRKYCRIADVLFRDDLPLAIHIPRDRDWEQDAAAFRKERLPADTPVAVCLGGRDWIRNYSIAFVERLLARFERDHAVLLFGLREDRPPDQRAEIQPVLGRHPDVVDLRDQLTLRELLFTLEASGALVTCDTGPIHMALGVGTPVVALFGHTPGTQLLGPQRASDRHAILTPDQGCRGCGYRVRESCQQARQALCMDRFDVERIAREVGRLFCAKR